MDYTKLLLTREDGIAVIMLNSPENLNSLTSGGMLDQLIQCLDDYADDDSVKVIIITGAGRAFCSGGDISGMKKGVEAGTRRPREIARRLGDLALRIRNLRKPIIASVRGPAAGAGCNLALACDFRIVTEKAYFLEAFVKIGLIPDMGGTFFLVKHVGVSRATELLMTARPLKAPEAFEWGLVNRIVPDDQLEAETLAFARTLASGASKTYGYIKAMINRAAFQGLELGLDDEVEYQYLCGATEDFREGISAFLEKRPPSFKGR